MAQIMVTSAQLRQTAGQLRDLNGQFKNQVGELGTTEATLKAQWEGEANEKFHAAFTRDKAEMDEFSGLIDQYVVALEQIAAEYEKAEQANADIATQRSY